MTGISLRYMAALFAFCCLASAASGQSSDSPDGLVKVKSRKMELAWLLPGADFRPYTMVIVDKTQVAFRQNWMKNYNMDARLGNKITQVQANEMMAAAQTNFDEILRDAFTKAGYQVVTAPGSDVLRVSPSIVDLTVNAPVGDSRKETAWIITAGQAALIVEVRDSATNAVLARVADRRATQDIGRQMASVTTNINDFRKLFSLWADICVRGLAMLKSASPVPEKLTPNQQLRGT